MKKRFHGFCLSLKLGIGNLLRLIKKRKTSNKTKKKLIKLLFSLIQYYNRQLDPIIIFFFFASYVILDLEVKLIPNKNHSNFLWLHPDEACNVQQQNNRISCKTNLWLQSTNGWQDPSTQYVDGSLGLFLVSKKA